MRNSTKSNSWLRPNNNRDFLLYAIGNLLPNLLSLLRLPIFTRHYSPEDFGYLTLVTITFSFLSLILFTSLSGCLWRYYQKYKIESSLPVLFTNLLLIYLFSFLILLIISLWWCHVSNDPIIQKLVIYSFLQIITGEVLSLIMIRLKLEGKAWLYNLILITKAALGFLILLFFAFNLQYGIDSFVTSMVIVNVVMLCYLFLRHKEILYFRIPFVDRSHLSSLLKYSFSGVFISFFWMVLVMSDRYIIKIFADFADVGIYNQIYMTGQMSIVAFTTVFMSIPSPRLTLLLEKYPENANKFLAPVLNAYFRQALPLTLILSLYCSTIANLLLGPSFRQGATIIPAVLFSALIGGLTEIPSIKLKFNNKQNRIILILLIGVAINVGLNFIFIPHHGYTAAAYTTLIAYLIIGIGMFFVSKTRFITVKTINLTTSGTISTFLVFLGFTLADNFIPTSYTQLINIIEFCLLGILMAKFFKLYSKIKSMLCIK